MRNPKKLNSEELAQLLEDRTKAYSRTFSDLRKTND